MLTRISTVSYLEQRDLILPRHIVDGGLAVTETPHRNAIFHVTTRSGPHYLVKQSLPGEASRTLQHEADIYRFLYLRAAMEAVRGYLPRFYLHDPDARILVIELFAAGQDLRWYHRRLARFPVAPAVEIARFLALLHRSPVHSSQDGPVLPISDYLPPSALSIHRPRLSDYNSLSAANLRLTSIIQQFPDFCNLLDQLRGEWREEALIHGDLKWANLILAAPPEGKRRELKVVDWELAGVGDPCWDAGSVFNDYLSFWLLSIPITGQDPPYRFLDLARYPLARMQPAMRAFWDAYVSALHLDPATARRWLLRSVCYAAARLVQAAFEESQHAAEPAGNVICFLQVALNMLQAPEQAAMHLMGIPWQRVWAA